MEKTGKPPCKARAPIRLSPASQLMLGCTEQQPGRTLAELHAAVCPGAATSGAVVESFRARLTYLVSAGHLVCVKDEGFNRYYRGTGEPPVKPARQYAARSEQGMSPLTPSAQYDRLRAPVYVPTQFAPARSGCQDFKRLASVGDRC